MTIDWETQWATFAPNFHNGFAHITLSPEATLRLRAGPGFGDLSHPTTRLCLKLLKERLFRGATVLDIGCGSGILSLSAALLGAKMTCGIDIEDDALTHARLNQQANKLTNVRFCKTPPQTLQPDLILMNMIHSEQILAWRYTFPTAQIITSGILATQRTEYLAFVATLGWTLRDEVEEDGWLAFLFN